MLCTRCPYIGGDYRFCWIIFDTTIFVKFGGWLSLIYDQNKYNYSNVLTRVYNFFYNWFDIDMLSLFWYHKQDIFWKLEIWNRTDLTSVSFWNLADERFSRSLKCICIRMKRFVFMCNLKVNLLIQLMFVINLLLFLCYYFLKNDKNNNFFSSF